MNAYYIESLHGLNTRNQLMLQDYQTIGFVTLRESKIPPKYYFLDKIGLIHLSILRCLSHLMCVIGLDFAFCFFLFVNGFLCTIDYLVINHILCYGFLCTRLSCYK